MVERLSRGKFPSLWFVKDFGVFGILWRKFLLDPSGSLGQSSGECELSDVRMILP